VTTALLIVECQRGVVGDLTFLPAVAEAAAPVLPTIGRLARGARASGVLVVHLTFVPAFGGQSVNQRSRMMQLARPALATWSDERPGHAVVDEIGVGPDDLVLPRSQGLSPVHRTETLPLLRNLGVGRVVVAGVSTNLAIPLVAVAAGDEDFEVVIPTDAIIGAPAEYHELALRHVLPVVGRLVTTDELLAEWAKGGR
jgi:nicotinamidase-related amidase